MIFYAFHFHGLQSSEFFTATFTGNFWLGVFHGQLFASRVIFPKFFTKKKSFTWKKKTLGNLKGFLYREHNRIFIRHFI